MKKRKEIMERLRGQKFMQTALGLIPYFLIATQSFWQKTPEDQKLNFSRRALFHKKTRVSLRYFVNDCSTLSQCTISVPPENVRKLKVF